MVARTCKNMCGTVPINLRFCCVDFFLSARLGLLSFLPQSGLVGLREPVGVN